MLPLAALTLTTVLVMVAFAVDLGRLRAERRDLQADADAIALDAVQKIAGLNAVDALPVAIAEANASAARNDFPATLTANEVQVGRWTPGSGTDDGTFQVQTAATDRPDAVRVDLTSSIPMFFDLQADNRSVTREAVAVARAQTIGQLGSVFGGIQAYDPTAGCAARASADAQMTFQNQIYTEYLGINVAGGVGAAADTGTVSCEVTGPADGLQFDALSYQGLAFGDLSLGDLAAQMGFGTVEELTQANVTARDVLTAGAAAMQASGDTADVQAGTILASVASETDSSGSFDFGDTVSAGSGGAAACGTPSDPQPCAADARINALQLLQMTAMAIDGNNLVTVDMPVSLPFVPGGVISPRIAVIEKPQIDARWKYAGEQGPRNAQVKVAVNVPLTGIVFDLADLGIPGVAGTQNLNGNIPLVIEVARADSLYDRIACGPGGVDGSVVDMLVETGAISIGFGAVTDAALQQAGDVGLTASPMVSGSIGVTLPGIPPLVPPTGISINLGAATTVAQRQTYEAGVGYAGGYDANANLLGATDSHAFTSPYETPLHRFDGGLSGTSITSDAFSAISWNAVSAGTLAALNARGVGQSAVNNLIDRALQPVIDELGSEVVDQLLTALGITVAGADGKILNVRCQVPALANQG